MAADEGERVTNRRAARDREAGQKDLRSEIAVTWNVESHFAGHIWNDIKVRVIPLQLQGVLRRFAEPVEPRRLNCVVIGVDGTPARETGQRLDIGRLLQITGNRRNGR